MAINKNKVMDAARKAYEKGQYDKAVKEYLKIVKDDPKDVRIWLKIGDLYAKKGSKKDATETYERVATFYSEQGFYQKAVAVYKQILKLDPKLVDVNLKLAELYRQLGLRSEAAQHFELVAAFFHREGKTQEALATIRQLVELDPENVATRIKLAELYSKEEMAKDAIVEFGHACEYLRKNNRQDDFIKVAERLLFHDSENMGLCRELAGLYLQREDPRRALAKLQVCFKKDSKDVDTLALLAQAFQKLDQKSKTVSVLKELAEVLIEKGKKKKAKDVHKKILEFVPNDSDSLKFLGRSPQGTSVVESPRQPVSDSSFSPVLKPEGSQDGPAPNKTGELPLVVPEVGVNISSSEETFASRLDLDDSQYDRIEGATIEGEAHSDEIVKILNETDVYIKYGLHQKAIDHLQKVFELDRDNIEGHERLKDIYANQGRESEAVTELLTLARVVAPNNAKRATNYLLEVISIDAINEKAFEIAERFGLSLVASEPESPSQVGGELEIVDDELNFDDLNFEEETNAEALHSIDDSSIVQVESVDEFEFDASIEDDDIEEIEDLDELGFEEIVEEPTFDPIEAAEFDADSMSSDVSQDEVVAIVAEPLSTELEDELDEADFFVSQGMIDEAKDILNGMLANHPGHPLITSKLKEISKPPVAELSIEDAVNESMVEEPSGGQAIKLEKPLDDGDAETRYDLALAYKEMGLYDEAIDSLEKIKGVPGREIQSITMIGVCYREDGNLHKSIEVFKSGLHIDTIKPDQELDLYYEMGSSYEGLGDTQEAQYYFEMILNKDDTFRDAASRLAILRGETPELVGVSSTAGGDVDDVLDNLFGDGGEQST